MSSSRKPSARPRMSLQPRRPAPVFAALLAAILALACSPKPQYLQGHILVHTRFDRPMPFAVLRAPSAPNIDPHTLPVVVVLHGVGDDHRAFDRHEVTQGLLDAMEDGRIPLAHFILPSGEKGFYTNWADGAHPYEDHIMRDVIRIAEDVLGVSPTREQRHILGVSMGAEGAVRLALTYPELFASVTAFSGLLMTQAEADKFLSNAFTRWFMHADKIWGRPGAPNAVRNADTHALLGALPDDLPLRFYLASGTQESREIQQSMARFKKALDQRQVPARFVQYDGGHGWRWWRPLISKALRWTLTPSEDAD